MHCVALFSIEMQDMWHFVCAILVVHDTTIGKTFIGKDYQIFYTCDLIPDGQDNAEIDF